MDQNLNKYNSIPFHEYLSKKDGDNIFIEYGNRLLKIKNAYGNIVAIVFFSKNINHVIIEDELLNKAMDKKEKAYYVYENGENGHDWLWFYGDLISVDQLF